MRRSITCLITVLAVSALLTLSPPTAHAIPIAGDYVFTSGLTGTFTSDGTSLTTWSFNLVSTPVVWTDSDVAQQQVFNNSNNFWFDDPRVGGSGGSSINLHWPQFLYTYGSSDGSFDLSGLFTWQPATPSSVPDPSSVVLLGIGLIALVAYGWRQQRQARVQVG
jgi:PEP-CTERM motif